MSDAPTFTRRLLVTAGPTQEPIDDVRYLSNRSSGRLGIALAETAAARGWATTLLLGPTPLAAPAAPSGSRLLVERFRTSAELGEMLKLRWPDHDVLIMAAAVSDYRPADRVRGKRPRGRDPWVLTLEPTPDLVAGLAASSRPGQTIVGFALGPADGLMAAARRKLEAKGLDGIVANPMETMDAERIRAALLLRDGRTLEPPPEVTAKRDFALWLLERIEEVVG